MATTSRQFDVYRNPLKTAREGKPFLVDLQHDFWFDMTSRIVAPLAIRAAIGLSPRLHPPVLVAGQTCYFDPTDIITLPLARLRNPIANLEEARDRIIAALDLVFTGI
jgi:toxin CcdB